MEYESVLIVKPEVFIYKIPPRASNRGYRWVDKSEWKNGDYVFRPFLKVQKLKVFRAFQRPHIAHIYART